MRTFWTLADNAHPCGEHGATRVLPMILSRSLSSSRTMKVITDQLALSSMCTISVPLSRKRNGGTSPATTLVVGIGIGISMTLVSED